MPIQTVVIMEMNLTIIRYWLILVRLRAERAKLLGYKTHSHIVLEPRMAKVPENVFKLLDNLWEKAIPVAKNEVAEMQKIIDREKGKFKLEPSDWWYYAEKLRKEKYDLNDSELRPYFKLENVRDGVFTVANKLFGITFTPLTDIPRPHPDAQAFEVKDADGSHLGVLYMDFYPRESKQQGAWCGNYRSYHVVNKKGVTPVVTTVFNFTRPSGDMPALLSVEEASTLYHEFGHALDALFNKSTYNQTNIAWDFVELPSQLMEHWATEPEVLNMYAKHYKTNEPIPAELVKKIKNSGYFNQGFETVEYLAASLLDMKYHTLEAPANVDVQSFEKEYLTNIGLIPEIIPVTEVLISFILPVGTIQDITVISGLQFMIMMLLKHLRKKVFSISQLQHLTVKTFLRRTVLWMQCRCI